jgi:hypothetical protein
LRRRALAAALGALAGAVPIAGCASRPALNVHVLGTGAADAPCRAEVDGRRILVAELPAFVGRWRGRTAHVTLEPATTAFRCFREAIFALQRSGLKRIGFISEPAPAEAPQERHW